MNNTTIVLFESPRPTINIQYMCFGSLAIAANLVILYILLRNCELLKKSALVATLALADIINGLAVLVNGSTRQMQYNDGTYDWLVNPMYCMRICTPLVLLGRQLAGAMFFLIGLERCVVVTNYQWFYANCSNKLAWIICSATFGVCLASVATAYPIAYVRSRNTFVHNECIASTIVGNAYVIYTYSIAVIGGISAVASSTTAAFILYRRQGRILQARSVSIPMKNHFKYQLFTTRVMFAISCLNAVLDVMASLVLLAKSDVTVEHDAGDSAWLKQVLTTRAVLNLVVYIVFSNEFRLATRRAFSMKFSPQIGSLMSKPSNE